MTRKYFPTISKFGYVSPNLVNATFSRNARPLMVKVFERILPVIGVRTSSYRLSVICKIVLRLFFIHRTQGVKGLVIYLKASTVLLQQALGGHVLSDTSGLNTRIARRKRGLPLIIPRQDRILILKGNIKLVKFYLTIFNLYRILEFPGKLKLHTITAPFTGDKDSYYYKRVLISIPYFVDALRKAKALPNMSSARMMSDVIPRSGPGTAGPLISSNPLVMLVTARRLKALGLDSHLTFFLRKFGQTDIPGLMDGHVLRTYRAAADLPGLPILPCEEVLLGRLGFKEEAAGKVRVFAMVDA
jgi:hypothetical protein